MKMYKFLIVIVLTNFLSIVGLLYITSESQRLKVSFEGVSNNLVLYKELTDTPVPSNAQELVKKHLKCALVNYTNSKTSNLLLKSDDVAYASTISMAEKIVKEVNCPWIPEV
ncbi:MULTISPECIES: hypothetical protein [unclassified Pseudoalteromonas]|uniref:hypothetical protein n=1 Tax=unclassified Pseudoalteromonas TaxID=194690 RepID=UPI000CF6EE8F|nr:MULTISPECIES: hypothetical protein [unclassified Pseudoalteromonas]